jgi:curved DNA-binding protein CbpA
MRSHALLALVLCLFAAFAAAWTKEDHEIFRIRDEVAKADGANVTFYDLLGVKPSASQDQLTQALRKKSRELHPDKARKVFVANYAKKNNKKKPTNKEIEAHLKKVTAAYQRLSVVGKMLKGAERERYDHFLRNGFPAWRGSGYYYERFRPGLGSVIVGLLAVFGGGFHYFALLMSWKRRREFAERYIRQARKTAWGDESGLQGIPGVDDTAAPVNAEQFEKDSAEDTPEELAPRNRRERRAMEKDARKPKKAQAVKKARADGISTPVEAEVISGPQGAKKRIVAENGKVLVVDSVGNVFLEIENEDGMKGEYLVDVRTFNSSRHSIS